jgi:hypothetical protein
MVLNQIFAYLHSSRIDDAKTITDIIGTSVTALAVIVGGIWAYFKFARGRTFAPRIEVMVSGQWRLIHDKQLVQARIAVRNIGASKVDLLQEGTALVVSIVSRDQPVGGPAAVKWSELGAFTILADHSWIEPSETIADDLLLDLGDQHPQPVLCRARLVWRRRRGPTRS